MAAETMGKIVTTSAPTINEDFLPPPGMDIPVEPVTEPTTPEKTDVKKIKWDYSKLLEGGTLGDLSANLHHGIAVGTDWKGWELDASEKNQYDKVLGMILTPLL